MYIYIKIGYLHHCIQNLYTEGDISMSTITIKDGTLINTLEISYNDARILHHNAYNGLSSLQLKTSIRIKPLSTPQIRRILANTHQRILGAIRDGIFHKTQLAYSTQHIYPKLPSDNQNPKVIK